MYRSRSLFVPLVGLLLTSMALPLLAENTNTENTTQSPSVKPTMAAEQSTNAGEQETVVVPGNTEADANEPAVAEQSSTAPMSDEMRDEMAHKPVEMANDNDMDEPVNETHRKVFFAFKTRFPTLPIESVKDGPHPGLFEIVTDSRVIYVDEEMTRLFQGNVIDLDAGVDLTEERLAGIHMGLINDLGEENMLIYPAKNGSKRNITVFTDINCGYCRLLHSEIDTLLEAGVNVRYLMFPRAGLDSDSRVALESVWCADDPQAAMTAAKAGEPIEQKSCETPVERHVELAQRVGLRGTPLIYLDNGTALPGYKEASVIIEMINSTAPAVN